MELNNVYNTQVEIRGLGFLKFKVRSIVCDMPATAYVLCMKQHIGYNSCPHCFIKVYHKNRRMLFKINKAFILRERDTFEKGGKLADEFKKNVLGNKSSTPFNKILSLPRDCPIDPMHLVFLSTRKKLSKTLLNLLK